MLPYTGTYAQLGTAITNGFKLAVMERGGRLGGRELEYFTVDDEAEPAKAPENTNKLVQRDKVDVLVGTVHSGVQMGMVKIAKETGTLLIIPNAGLDAATGALCAPNIFRSSFSNWQPSYPMGKVLAERGIKNVVTFAWKYGAGEEAIAGFTEGFIKAGGKSVRGLWIPFPNVEFQALLTEIASIKPDAVFVFFAGGGAAKLIKDYAAAGLRTKIPLFGSGFLTDGVLDAVEMRPRDSRRRCITPMVSTPNATASSALRTLKPTKTSRMFTQSRAMTRRYFSPGALMQSRATSAKRRK